MKNTRRLRVLCGELRPCARFADVGCDHGYCTQYMLERNLCRTAVISDISAGSLHKAETLLAPYIAEGRVRSVCCAGLSDIPRDTDEVLIAGMGGEEIVSILEEGFLPPVLVLQPMKNAPKLRRFLLERGYALPLRARLRDRARLHFYRYQALRPAARRARRAGARLRRARTRLWLRQYPLSFGGVFVACRRRDTKVPRPPRGGRQTSARRTGAAERTCGGTR